MKFLNRLLGHRISDYYFYKWLRTKKREYLNKYLEMTS